MKISSPASAQSISGILQSCVSLSGTNISNVILEISGDAGSTYTTLQSGTPTSSSYCGTLNSYFYTDGDYTLRATATNSQGAKTVTTNNFTVANGTTLGANVHFAGEDGQVDDMASMITPFQQAHLKTVRITFNWSWIESTKGTYSLTSTNAKNTLNQINTAVQNGIHPVIVLLYSNSLYGPIVAADPTNATELANAALARTAFSKYASYLAQALGDKVSMYEVWNEWNGGFGLTNGVWNTYPANDVVSYVDLLCKTYSELMAVNPNLTVIGGVNSGIDAGWTKSFFNNGGLSCMSAYSIHPYQAAMFGTSASQTATMIDSLHNTVKALPSVAGANVPFMITEDGLSTYQTCTSAGVCTYKHSIADQANYYSQMLDLIKARPYIKLYQLYKMRNGGNTSAVTDEEENFGLLNYKDYSPKVDANGVSAFSVFVNKTGF
jgi:hypothetical protein